MTDPAVDQSYSRSNSAKAGLESKDKDRERLGAKIRAKDWNSEYVETSSRNDQSGPLKKDSLSSGGHLHLKTSPSAYSRHRGGPTRESLKPATIPRESSPAKSRIRYEDLFSKQKLVNILF